MNAILYVASTGCQGRQLPKDFPPYSTVQGYFYAWSRNGTFASLNHALVMASREAAGCEASPTPGRHAGGAGASRAPYRVRLREVDDSAVIHLQPTFPAPSAEAAHGGRLPRCSVIAHS